MCALAALVALVFFLALPAEASGQALPALRFEAPEMYQAEADRLAAVEPERLARVMAIVGLDDPGPPVRVVLAGEDTAEARRVPRWVAGYAVGPIGLVVLLPQRSPTYPDRSLDAVLLHEVSHVLLARAAGRNGVARWFNEGVAMAASPFGLGDRFELVRASLRRGDPSFAALDRSFPSGPRASARAYAFSGAVVRFLLDRHGDDAAARILSRVRAGSSFEDAFAAVVREPLDLFEARYWRQTGNWRRFLPLLTSPTIQWFLLTLLFLLAYIMRRRRDQARRAAWAEEDARAEAMAKEEEPWQVEAPRGGWVH